MQGQKCQACCLRLSEVRHFPLSQAEGQQRERGYDDTMTIHYSVQDTDLRRSCNDVRWIRLKLDCPCGPDLRHGTSQASWSAKRMLHRGGCQARMAARVWIMHARHDRRQIELRSPSSLDLGAAARHVPSCSTTPPLPFLVESSKAAFRGLRADRPVVGFRTKHSLHILALDSYVRVRHAVHQMSGVGAFREEHLTPSKYSNSMLAMDRDLMAFRATALPVGSGKHNCSSHHHASAWALFTSLRLLYSTTYDLSRCKHPLPRALPVSPQTTRFNFTSILNGIACATRARTPRNATHRTPTTATAFFTLSLLLHTTTSSSANDNFLIQKRSTLHASE
ncbi:uncharacterized protein MYCFIDRAFT_173513 [Pseudocercospora fijiensis CIRAD86]|uniref:Uncharacterized protein n=1 Tax=Pseudocercospora fijiensis (strain CIRAD86) TaxID=383855 RepID=M3B5A6_PSEFD|nr:uncharacterized protein MYCFIDRAFT_173513 [Pseudocercospora fijiensis CIRAD86]EME84548.1 hypothetical protein MYCFIDRAFT_173513 [Pseudocercospora fijiensis CIRAD86]